MDPDLIFGALRNLGAFLEKSAAPQNLRRRCLAALPKTRAIFSGKNAVGVFFFDSFLLHEQKK